MKASGIINQPKDTLITEMWWRLVLYASDLKEKIIVDSQHLHIPLKLAFLHTHVLQ